MKRAWDRQKWRNKKEINRILHLRNQDPANQTWDWNQPSSSFTQKGAIYCIYHFTTGRWYVGQIVGTIAERAQGHWWSRYRADDAFHQALALENDPFAYITLPLEWIPSDQFRLSGRGRRQQVAAFRKVATPRERYWVDQLNSMWPHGWNSAVPGRPVASYVLRQHRGMPQDEDPSQPASTFVNDWLPLWKRDPEAAMQS